MNLPHITVLTCTFLRPQQLANHVAQFEVQIYPKSLCELLILDDAGQYPTNPSGENWQVISIGRRFSTLGEKRNALASLASPKTDAFCPIDDDDFTCPWALQAHATALEHTELSIPGSVWVEHKTGRLLLENNKDQFHPSWCYDRSAFRRVAGYHWIDVGEDYKFRNRLQDEGVKQSDPTVEYPPFWLHRWENSGSYHLSGAGGDAWQKIGQRLKNGEKELFAHLPKPKHPDFVARIAEWMGFPVGTGVSIDQLADAWKAGRDQFKERSYK